MKKFLSLILVLVLILSLSIPAMAATVTEKGNQTADVKAKYVDSTTKPVVYSVDIAWGSMEFAYTESGTKTWNPTDHSYTTTGASAAWTPAAEDANSFKVTNHSNNDIRVHASFASAAGFTSVTGGFVSEFGSECFVNSNSTWDISSGERTSYEEARNYTFFLNLSGDPGNLSADQLTTVGTITLTIDGQ